MLLQGGNYEDMLKGLKQNAPPLPPGVQQGVAFSQQPPSVGQMTGASTGTPPAQQNQVNPPSQNAGFYSSGLEGLKGQIYNQNWTAESPYANLFKGYMQQLATPLDLKAGLTPEQLAAQTNQIRSNIMGGTKAMMGQMENKMGGRGFRAGDSGFADTALAGVAREGQSRLSDALTTASLENARQEKANELQLAGLNTQRLLGAGQYGGLLENSRQSGFKNLFDAIGTGGGLEQFEKNYGLQERQLGQAGANAAAAQDRWSQEFEYGKQQDALKLLMGFYGGEQGAQNDRYAPYWNASSRY